MMFPRRVPFMGAVPLPMISSCPRSVTSPTSTHTFDVPISSATTYFSSVFGIGCSYLVRDLRRNELRPAHFRQRYVMNRFHNETIGEADVGIGDLAAAEVVGPRDSDESAPLGKHILLIGIDERAELPIEQSKSARRQRPHFRDSRIDLCVAYAELANQRDTPRQIGAARVRDQREIGVADVRREFCELDP